MATVAAGPQVRLEQGPAELRAIVQRACAPRPEDRYADAAELQRDVQAWSAGRRVAAYEYTLLDRVVRTVRRYRSTFAVAGVALGLSMAFVVAEAWRLGGDLSVALREQALVALGEGADPEAASLAARSLSLREHPDARGAYLVATSRFAPRPLDATPVAEHCGRLRWTGAAPHCDPQWPVRLRDGTALSLVRGQLEGWSPQAPDWRGLNWVTPSPDGATVAVGTWLQGAQLFDAATGARVRRFEGLTTAFLTFTPDGAHLVGAASAVSGYVGIQVWDVASGAVQATANPMPTGINDLALGPSGERLAVVGYADEVVLCSVPDLRCDQRLFVGESPLERVTFAGDGARLAVRTPTQQRTWNLARAPAPAHDGQTLALAFSEGGELVTAGHDGWIHRYDAATGALRDRWSIGEAVQALTFVGDELAVGLEAGDILLLRGREEVQRFAGAGSPYALAHHEGLLGFAGHGSEVVVVDLAAGRERWRSEPLARSVNGVMFWGEELVATVWNDEFHSFRLDDGAVIATGEVPVAGRPSLHGDRVALPMWDDTVALRRLPDLTLVDAVHNPARAMGTAFSPDGRWLATASFDGAVRVFDLRRRTEQARMPTHAGQAWTVAFSPDGSAVASVGVDGRLHFVRLDELALPGRRTVDQVRETQGLAVQGGQVWSTSEQR